MVLPGHLAGGYLAARALMALSNPALSRPEINALYIITILAAEAPDLDLIRFFFEHRSLKLQKTDSHRKYASHAPAAWLFGSFVIVLAGYLLGIPFVSYAGLAVLCGSWSHFILDSVEYGIMWLWPFSKKMFALRYPVQEEIDEQIGTISYYWQFIKKYYCKYITFYLELIVIAVAVWVAFH
jgi:hypothetical protein